MVKRRIKNTRKSSSSKGFKINRAKARKINASTAYDTCTEQPSPFGGLLPLIKVFDVVKFKEIFSSAYDCLYLSCISPTIWVIIWPFL
jgi:hypothetical protein